MIENRAAHDEVTTLEDYIEAIKNRKWVVLATALAILLLAIAATSRQIPTYVATGTVEVLPSLSGSSSGFPALPNMDLEAEKILGDDVRQAVAATLDIDIAVLPQPDVEFLPTSRVLFLERRDSNAEAAAAILNAYAEAYTKQRIDNNQALYDARILPISAELASNQSDLAALVAERERVADDRIDLLRDQTIVAELKDDLLDANNTLRLELSNDINTLASNLRVLQTRLQQERIGQASAEEAASIISEATVPTSPSGIPNMAVWIAAGIAGLLFGTAVSFLVERLDATARNEDDVSLALGSKVLGSVPTFGFGNRGGPASAVMLINDRKPRLAQARESIRRLRSSLQFAAASSDGQVFLMTSAFPGEGKSVVSANLAAALAQSGKKVALVNADMRRPTMELILSVPNTEGLSNFLTGREEVMNLREVQGVSGLFFVPAGPPPSNPGELLGSPQFERLIKDLRTHADYVLIDSPPVLSTADAVTASRFADGVIVVVDSRRTETSDLLRVREDLDRAGATLIGAVLNKVRAPRGIFGRRDAYVYYGTGQS